MVGPTEFSPETERQLQVGYESSLRAYPFALSLSYQTSTIPLAYDKQHGPSFELEQAVELLETRRAITWSRMQGLQEANADLATRFRELSDQLEPHAIAIRINHQPRNVLEYYRRLLLESDQVVEEIRRNAKGFENFLQPITYSTIRKAASGGPVIIVNINRYVGCNNSSRWYSWSFPMHHQLCCPTLLPTLQTLELSGCPIFPK